MVWLYGGAFQQGGSSKVEVRTDRQLTRVQRDGKGHLEGEEGLAVRPSIAASHSASVARVSQYYGENLAAKGVVIVSCNYRLGALGFMVSVDDGVYGNHGLQDQR